VICALAFEAPAPRLENCVMKIGQVIRKIRTEKGATLEEVALAAGTDPANLSRVERNMQQLTPETLEKIAQALGMPVSSLYLIAEQTTTPYQVTGSQETADKAAGRLEDFVAKFMLLSPENQQLLVEFVNAMLKAQQLR
jgi:transcriptional regulator with XRE-family HTH domain